MMTPYIKFAKLTEKAIVPTKRDEDGGFDIFATIEKDYYINPFTTRSIPTGLASEIPKDWTFILFERGSTGSKGIKRSAGVVDSGFRGEWQVFLTNTAYKTVVLSVNPERTKQYLLNYLEAKGRAEFGSKYNPMVAKVADKVEKNYIIYPVTKAIAQAVLFYTPHVTPQEVPFEELNTSERGDKMLGSTNS